MRQPFALGWSPEDIARRTSEAFGESFDDMTLPFLSFKRGGKHSRMIREFFGDKVYRVLVPRNVRLAEAPSYGTPAVVWDQASKGAQAYLAFVEEVLARETAVAPTAQGQGA